MANPRTPPRRPPRIAALLVLWACGCRGSSPAVDARADLVAGSDAPRGDARPADHRPAPDRAALRAFPLPASLDLGGEPSSVTVVDLDGDGLNDLVALVAMFPAAGVKPYEVRLIVAWGDDLTPFADRTALTVGFGPPSPSTLPATSLRDTSSNVLGVGDWSGDGRLDVVTASGAALASGSRSFDWVPLPSPGAVALPALLLDLEGKGELVLLRGTSQGKVERCPSLGSCVPLAGQEALSCPAGARCAIEDLDRGDFDGDGKPDLLAGGVPLSATAPEGSAVWLSSKQWQSRLFVEGLHPVDYEVGDLDGDGLTDVVAQQREFISDFPSNTHAWRATPKAAAPFTHQQEIGSHQNHTDNAALADVDGDGCLDYMEIGVDDDVVALRRGSKSGASCSGLLGDHDPAKPRDVGWQTLPITGGHGVIGVQQLDVNGDGKPEWVLRAVDPSGAKHLLLLLPIPKL